MENLKIKYSGYGQWHIYTTYYGKTVSLYTTDSELIDNIRDGKKWAIKEEISIIRIQAKEKL